MNDFVFPCSPNWFLSSVTSGNSAGLYAFGAKNHVFIYDTRSLDHTSHSDLTGDSQGTGLLSKVPKLVSCFSGHEQKVTSVCLSPDGEQLLCCSADETTVRVWDILSLTTIQSHSQHKDKITCMTWSPCDTDLLLTASEKGMLVLWRLKSNTVTQFQPLKDYALCMKASPHSSSHVAIGYRSCVVLIVSVEQDRQYVVQKLRGLDAEVTSICWCPIGGKNWLEIAADDDSKNLVAAAGGRLIKVWNIRTGNEIFYKKLPYVSSSYKLTSQDPLGKKTWLDIQWPRSDPGHLISSSSGSQSDLFLWNLHEWKQQEPDLFDCTRIKKHSRLIFNVTLVGHKICTFSLDRIIAVWDLKTRKGLVSWCSFGGYVYSIRASPVDPGMVAVGAGDNAIRVWNQNNRSKLLDISFLSYGGKTMITAVAWHPEKEGLLAYGTDDGRVGIINTLTAKPPVMSSTAHKKMVYVVCWGPPLNADKGSSRYQVYSVGDGTILQHFIEEIGSQKKAVNVMDAVHAVNGPENEPWVKSELIWKTDFTIFAIGGDNGLVNLYRFPGLRQVCAIHVHHRIINCIRWHPETTAESVHSSPCRNWLAFAGNDRHISVVDLPNLFVNAEADTGNMLTMTQAFCQLPGHITKTTDMCWSPHNDGRLVSTGYDRTAIVWNVKTGEGLVSYSGHCDRLLTVLWSYLDPDLIMTAGCDSTVRLWKVSAQTNCAIDVKARKKNKKKYLSSLGVGSREDIKVKQSDGFDASEKEMKELQDLLLARQQELLLELQPEPDVAEIPPLDDDADLLDVGCDTVTDGQLLSQSENYRRPVDSGVDTDGWTPALANKHRADVVITSNGGTAPTTVSRAATNHSDPPARVLGKKQIPESAYPPDIIKVQQEHETVTDDNDEGDQGRPVLSVKDLVPPVKPLVVTRDVSAASTLSHTGSVAANTGSVAANTEISDRNRKRKVKPKSLFPLASTACNRGKASLHEDIVDLSRIIGGQSSAELVDNKPHLGLFTDRLGAHRCLLQESEYHLSHGNMEYHLQLELWRGNVAGAIQIARQRNELSDWIVSMAPLASHDLWEIVSAEYAEQLEEDGQYHKAATYLLAAHKVHQAVDLFRRHKLYKEAVSLAKIRLSPLDPVLEDLYTEWGQSLMKDGQYEQAATCYLAMRQIQEAEKALSKRHDQSSLKTVCHMTLLASDKQQGLVHANKLFTQYLMAGEWKEAYKFILEYPSLKVLLPILYTHELLVQNLTALCPLTDLTQKKLSRDMLSVWEKKELSKKKVELPEFLLDKSEIDLVVPWEPFLIGKHTFAHHLLRIWHQHLDITMVTEELKIIQATISQLVPHRQNLLDLPGILVQVSVDITLCLLALLTSETSSAAIYLLQAMSTLHQANHLLVHQALCRLMLPQGPKYLLKLQQEFNACRVLITMEMHGDIDRSTGENHGSIKKFLTDIKEDDSGISTAGVRCRELDCLRAYYYLAILNFLQETFLCVHHENDSHDGMPNGKTSSANQNVRCSGASVDSQNRNEVQSSGGRYGLHNSSADNGFNPWNVDKNVLNKADLDQNGKMSFIDDSSVNHPVEATGDAHRVLCSSDSKDCVRKLVCDVKLAVGNTSKKQLDVSSSVDSPVPSVTTRTASGISQALGKSSSSLLQDQEPSLVKLAAGSSDMSLPSAAKDISSATLVRGCLNYSNLLRLSKGILWDVQAKREALTETLGYVHQAISQHLLLNRSTNESNYCDVGTTDFSASFNNSSSSYQPVSNDHVEDGGCQRTRLLSPSSSCLSETTSDDKQTNVAGLANKPLAMSSDLNFGNSQPAAPTSASPATSLSENGCSDHSSSHLLTQSSLEVDLLDCLTSQPTAFQTSRKVLWTDGLSADSASSKPTFQISRLAPDGIPVPLEWDELPVDIKYSMSYVTLPLLKQEQEMISQELKKVPDASRVPFPATSICVKELLHTSLQSPHLSLPEKRIYIKQLSDWSAVFAVTTYQQKEMEALFAAEHLGDDNIGVRQFECTN